MKKYFIALVSILILNSCSKDEPSIETVPPTTVEASTDEMPTILDPIEIDIDDDGVIDYRIEYLQFIIEPILPTDGGSGIGGVLQPVGRNEILRHKEDGYLFLRDLDDIQENVEEPLNWRSVFFGDIVTITAINAEGQWPLTWTIDATTEFSTYFIGLKLVSDSGIQLAWVEIDIDISDGSISVIDKGII